MSEINNTYEVLKNVLTGDTFNLQNVNNTYECFQAVHDETNAALRVNVSNLEPSLESMIVINSPSDLPTPIDLGDGLGLAYRLEGLYSFGNSMTLGYPIAPTATASANLNENLIDGNLLSLTYSGSGAFIRANTTNYWNTLIVDKVSTYGDSGNAFIDLNGTGAQLLSIFSTSINGFGSLGEINAQNIFQTRSVNFNTFTTGLTMTNNVVNIIAFTVSSTVAPIGGSHFNIFGANFSTGFHMSQFIPIAGDSIINIHSGYTGYVDISSINVVTAYGGTPFSPTGLDQTNNQILASNNRNIPNSKSQGWMYLSAITNQDLVADTPELITGTTLGNGLNENFTHDGILNKLTYIGIEDFSGFITATIHTNGTGAVDRTFRFIVYKNGLDLNQPVGEVRLTTTSDRKNITLQNHLTLETGDYVQVYNECIGSSDDYDLKGLEVTIK